MKKRRTIVFEDNPSVQELLKLLLERRNHETVILAPYQKCPLFQKHQCRCGKGWRCADFLVTDLYMPEINGLDWIKSQLAQGCRIPAMAVVSGSCTETEKQEAEELGCAVFEKPFDIYEFEKWLVQTETEIDNQTPYAQWFRGRKPANCEGDSDTAL